MSTLVNVKDLSVSYFTYAGEVQSVRGVSFEIEKPPNISSEHSPESTTV